MSCYTLLSGFQLPWPLSCCLDELTPFVVSDEHAFQHLNLMFSSSHITSSAYQKWPTRNSQSLSSQIKQWLILMTWWTIETLLLTNLLTIYIHFSHTPAKVVTTSLIILYLPSNPLQPCSVACMSLWIVTKLLTLICQWFLWPYSHWNTSPLPKHSLISSTCINRLLECDQSLKLALLWILDLQSLTVSDLLSLIKPQNPHLYLRTYPKVC